MSEFRNLLENSKEQVFTAEFPAIDAGGMTKVEKYAKEFAPWFTAVNSTDNTSAHAHASNVAVAIAMKLHGLEPIMQIVCRDKNRLAIQADMAGANLHGIENISLLTGDDVTAGDEPEARRVFDLDGPQAIKVATVLNKGTYLSGRKYLPPSNFYIGSIENPFAPPHEYRIERAAKKEKAGARYLQLQIGDNPELLAKFCLGVAETSPGLHLFPTIILVKSAKALRRMDSSVPGVSISKEFIEKVEASVEQRELTYQWSLAQSRYALTLPGVRGLHIIDFGHQDDMARLMTDLGRTAK